MALGQKLEMRQGQSLVMTPQLQQAIKMLQLSSAELSAVIEEELERNPLLERAGGDDDETDPREPRLEGPADAGAADPLNELDAAASDIDPDAAPYETDAPLTAGSEWSDTGGGGSFDESDSSLERYAAAPVTLSDHLEAQLTLTMLSGADRLIALHLIDLTDEAGYLRADLTETAARLGVDEDSVLRVLQTCQGFDPAGVMARSVRECLALQLREKDRLDPIMETFLDHLHLLAARDFTALRRACEVDEDDLADMIREVRALTPKPGAAFAGEPARVVEPDVIVAAHPDGGWQVELNTHALPRVLMNNRYYARVKKHANRDEDKAFIESCAQEANWLVKSLDQRARTILKVSREIVRQQDAFLDQGVEHMRPMTLKMVADAIEMHESTVSRVTSNKYIATPRGLFELKFFFSAALPSLNGGQAFAAEAVRAKIKAMIDAETSKNVLSDDRIVDALREAGIEIARRTVAKYREAMRIPSSAQRRRELSCHFNKLDMTQKRADV